MVQEKDLEIELPDGATEAVLYTPAGDGPWPGVLYLTDIGGIRPPQRQAAQRLSAEGYLVLMPNVFYRVAKPPVLDLALRSNPELFMKRVMELAQPLDADAQERDAHGYVDFLSSQPNLSDPNKIGVVGFCFCGAVAMRVAAAFPDRIAACASFHGGNLYESKPESPHLLLPRIQARLLFGHAVEDRSMPAEAIHSFEELLEEWGGQYESETYAGARHGWTTFDSQVYHPEQAARAYEKLKQLFADTLH
jgi:carboxymethylenebutenolidase